MLEFSFEDYKKQFHKKPVALEPKTLASRPSDLAKISDLKEQLAKADETISAYTRGAPLPHKSVDMPISKIEPDTECRFKIIRADFDLMRTLPDRKFPLSKVGNLPKGFSLVGVDYDFHTGDFLMKIHSEFFKVTHDHSPIERLNLCVYTAKGNIDCFLFAYVSDWLDLGKKADALQHCELTPATLLDDSYNENLNKVFCEEVAKEVEIARGPLRLDLFGKCSMGISGKDSAQIAGFETIPDSAVDPDGPLNS